MQRAESPLRGPSAEFVVRLRSSHAFYDSSRNGRVSLSELGDVLRGAGLSPTETELALILKRVEPVYGSRLSSDVCIVIASTIAAHLIADPLTRDEIRHAFDEFESLRSSRRPPLPHDSLSLSDTHNLLTGPIGDRLSQSEFVNFLSRLPTSRTSGPARIDLQTLLDITFKE
jgi:Ca2+-binding EF-hand superfamily protein